MARLFGFGKCSPLSAIFSEQADIFRAKNSQVKVYLFRLIKMH